MSGLGLSDDPLAWERIATSRAAIVPPAAPKEPAEWMLAAQCFQLDLLLAERPKGMLADFSGPEKLRDEAADLAGMLGADYAGWFGWQLAEMLFLSGRLTAAQRVTTWLLDELGGKPGFILRAPRIHYLRAELARQTGNWSELDRGLAVGMAALAAAEPVAQGGSRPDYLEDKARLLALRAQVQIVDLGLLDQGEDLLRDAQLAAEESGNPSPQLAVLLVRVDKLLMQEQFQQVIDLLRPPRLEGGPFESLYLSVEGPAALELERQGKTPEPAAAELFRELLASESLDAIGRLAAQVHLADALMIESARQLADAADDAADSEGDADAKAELRATLSLARGLARKTRGSDGQPLEDEGVLAVLEWRYATDPGGVEALLPAYDRLLAASRSGAPGSWTLRLLELQVRRALVVSARAHVLQAYDDLLSAWRDSAPRPGGIGYLQYQARRTRLISAAVDTDLASSPGEEGLRAALERLFEVQAMGSLARELGLKPCLLDQVRDELLAKGEGCLVFLPAADASHLFAFDGSTLKHYRLLPLDDLQELVEDARVFKGAAREKAGLVLRDAILPTEARRWIDAHHDLTLSGFGLLPGLQLEELIAWSGAAPGATQATPTALLGERFAIASLPSVPLGLSLARRARARSAPVDALVLAVNPDPRGVAGLKPFSFGDAERRALSAPFPAKRTRYLADASRADLAGLAKQRHGIVHVFCHGVWDRDEEVGAALVLAMEGDDEHADLVHPDDLPALEADVLILTACDAKRGPQRLGDDLAATLGGQALARGASCALVADGRVEVGAALQMGAALTRELAGGASPAEALRRATAELPEQAKRTRYRVLGLGHVR